MATKTTIKRSSAHDYWHDGHNVWFPRCAWYEAAVAPARDVDAGEKGWAWYAGEVVDPLAGGWGSLRYEGASLRGVVGSRREAEKLAREAFHELMAVAAEGGAA